MEFWKLFDQSQIYIESDWTILGISVKTKLGGGYRFSFCSQRKLIRNHQVSNINSKNAVLISCQRVIHLKDSLNNLRDSIILYVIDQLIN